jgi:hypothetical protein
MHISVTLSHPFIMMGNMNDGGVRTAVEALVGTDLSVADHAGLADASRAVARLQSFVDLAKVQIARRGRKLADEGDTSSAHTLIDEGRCTGSDVKHTNGRDRVCGDLPDFEDALATGAVTGAHLDALAHHTRSLTDAERSDLAAISDELVADATEQPPALFDRTVKGRIDAIRNQHRPDSDVEALDRQRAASSVKRWTDRDTGMKNTMLSLDPIRDASLWNVIDHHLGRLRHDPANAERPFGQLQVEAVLASIDAASGERRIPEIVAHVDHRSLCHGRHADTLAETADGTAIPVATVRRLCCEAIIQAVIVQPDGTVDQLCAEQRTANRRQRRMLEAMYSTCAHPHCEVAFTACRIHHVIWWTKGGKTVLANLLPLCETHHHLVHEGGWNLVIDEQRTVTWLRPDGSVWLADAGPDRTGARRTTQRAGPPARASADRCERPPGRPPPDESVDAGRGCDSPGSGRTPSTTIEQPTLL